jgi:WD40 repeat protein
MLKIGLTRSRKKQMKENIIFPISGGIAGTSVYFTIGGIGIVGGFGGIGIGMAGMTAAGTMLGSAVYGAFQGIENEDPTAFTAMGLGAIGGVGVSTTIGGIGVSFGGSVFGIGMGSMAAMGGIFGLGVYGLAKMFSSSTNSEPIAETFNRMEDRITYEEVYYQAMIELDPILAELSWEQKFAELEFEEELEILKSQIRAKKRLIYSSNIYDNSFNFINDYFDDYSINTDPDSLDIEKTEEFVWKLVKTLIGHTAKINSLATKNNIIATASDDQTVVLWDLETEKQIFSFFETSEVYSVALNTQIVGAGNYGRIITTWKLDSKALNHIFSSKSHEPFLKLSYNHDSHDGLIYSLVLSNDGRTLFSGSADKTIRVWNTATGQLQSTLKYHTDSVLSLAITLSNNFLISGSADKTIRILNLKDLSQKPQILGLHDNWVTTLAITSNGQYLVSGSRDSTIKLWDLSTKKQVYTITGHTSAVLSVAISPNGNTIVSGSLDTVKLWDLASGNLLQTIQATAPVIFSDNGKSLITRNSKNQIDIWQRLSVNNQLINDSQITKQWWMVLGVEQNASITEIKTAYYNLARQYHPDINTSNKSKKMMQIISQAYHQAKSCN